MAFLSILSGGNYYLLASFAGMPHPLYLLPVPVSQTDQAGWISHRYQEVLRGTSLFFVEEVRTARRFISSLKLGISIDSLRFEVLNQDTGSDSLLAFSKMLGNEQAVLMSESGCPGVADPGAKLVSAAHGLGIQVIPFIGPSSLILALMASGLSGQHFCFHGYLPIEAKARSEKIKALERESAQRNQTQIFIETPYRNQVVWKAMLTDLRPETRLAFARDVTGSAEKIQQMSVAKWRQHADIEWDKLPTVFLFQA